MLNWRIPAAILVSVALLSWGAHGLSPQDYPPAGFMVFSGGLMLGAVFMATDMVSSPMTRNGQLIYGVGIGLLTVIIRVWGAYPEGMSFAILIMNATVPLLNNAFKPTRFGKEVKHG